MCDIVLMGDAMVDNFSGLDDQSHDLSWSLQKLGYKVKNAACDGSNVSNVLNSDMIPKNKRSYKYDLNDNGKLDQFKILDIGNEEQGKNIPTVVLSIGGNDMKQQSISFLLGADVFIKNLLSTSFQKNYNAIIEKILSITPRLILVVVLEPCIKSAPYSLISSKIKAVYTAWRNFIYTLAIKHNLPVIDLSKTLDSSNSDYYGKNNTSLNNNSSKIFSSLIKEVVDNYEGTTVYYCKNCSTKITKKLIKNH